MLSEETKWSVVAQNASGDSSTLADLQLRLAHGYFAMTQAMVDIPPPVPADVPDSQAAVAFAAYLDSGRGALAEGIA